MHPNGPRTITHYLWRFIQKKSQPPNFSEKVAIEKCIAGLLPSQLASLRGGKVHKVRCRPQKNSRTMKIDEAASKLASRQPEQINSRQSIQYIFPMEPSQKEDSRSTGDPYIAPPTTQPFNMQLSNHCQDLNREGRSARGRGHGRGRGHITLEQPRKFCCHFHGTDSEHNTNQ